MSKKCPLGGDEKDCDRCAYSPDYLFKDGVCRLRPEEDNGYTHTSNDYLLENDTPREEEIEDSAPALMRKFESGATRNIDKDKLDYEGFLSPLVLKKYAEYLHKNRIQADGELRNSDNWQNGIPLDVYMKSALRHIHDVWMEHRGYKSRDGLDEALGGLLFNIMGYWFEILKKEEKLEKDENNNN